VVGLLQSWCPFRVGDPRDAEQAARVAMAVYQSAIRADPRSRAQMRVTPEVVLNLPRHHCLASWIVKPRAGLHRTDLSDAPRRLPVSLFFVQPLL
jgi:hypothetical protein